MNSNRKSVAMVSSTLLITTVLLIAGGGVGLGFLSAHAATSPLSLNSVQILVHTSGANTNLTLYDLTIYNSTGYPVVTSSSDYPGFGAQLPSGKYLFTVSATQQNSYYYYPVVNAAGGVSSGSVSGVSSPVSNSSVALPIKTLPPMEYGYSLQTINGASSFTINTSSLYNMSTTNIVVYVSYVNGTAASGAYVEASLIGASYYGANNWVTWGETSSSGSFTLQVPSVPFEVYAYSSVQVNIPQKNITYETTIGGQTVNVTAYWQPVYFSLEGYQLVIPPQSSVNIVLHVQQPKYVIPYEAAGLGQTLSGAPVNNGVVSTTVTSVQTAPVEGQASSQAQVISPLSGDAVVTKTVATTITSQGISFLGEALTVAVILAVVLSVVSVVLVLRRKPVAIV